MKPVELINTDLWGPAPIASSQGYLTISVSLMIFLASLEFFLSKAKLMLLLFSQSSDPKWKMCWNTKLKLYAMMKVGSLSLLIQFTSENGIQIQLACPYTSAQNGRVERKHRHIVETGLAMFAQAKMPLTYWWDAFHTATFLINQIRTSVIEGKDPFCAAL